MNNIFPYSDIAYGSVVYVIIALLSLRKMPSNIRSFFIVQLIVLYVLLLIVHIYAFYNYKSFPALGEDSLLYDKLANYLSQQYHNGVIDLGFKHYNGFNLTGYRVFNYSTLDANVPYGFVILHSIIYYIFGYLPFVAKVFNVYALHFASKYFYKLLIHYNINHKVLKRTLILFAFFPPLMISSFSFVKESLFMLTFVALIYYIVLQRPAAAFPWFIISVLIRPYTPIVFILVYLFYNRQSLIKQFGKYTVLLSISVGILSLFSFQAFSIARFVSETKYTIYYDPMNLDKFVSANGLLDILILVVSSPLMFFKFFAYGIFTALFKPDPWHFQISSLYLNSAYINGRTFSFSILAYSLYAFILYFLHFTFIKYILNKRYYKHINIKFDVLFVFIMITVIIFIRAVELRYLIMSTYPIVLLIFAKIRNVNVRIPNTNTYIVYALMILGLLMVPVIF